MKEQVQSERNDERLTALLRRCGKFLYFHSKPGIGQGEVLRLLRDGPLTQKEIQERLGSSPGTVSELITKLEGKNCLTRRRSETDRRKALLTLTEKGRSFAERHAEYITEGLFQVLTDAERDTLEQLLETLVTDWAERRV